MIVIPATITSTILVHPFAVTATQLLFPFPFLSLPDKLHTTSTLAGVPNQVCPPSAVTCCILQIVQTRYNSSRDAPLSRPLARGLSCTKRLESKENSIFADGPTRTGLPTIISRQSKGTIPRRQISSRFVVPLCINNPHHFSETPLPPSSCQSHITSNARISTS